MKKKVAVVGATGVAGQQFITALSDHPWFELVALAGSENSARKTYNEALRTQGGRLSWFQPTPIPEQVAKMTVQPATELKLDNLDIVFTATDTAAARELEPLYAKHKPVISTASAFRMEEDVPLLIPGINTAHKILIARQRKNRAFQGFIIPIPNCTVYGLACTLAPLYETFGVKAVVMTSLQATSGAGRMSGVLAMDMIDNVIPYIPDEEEKVEVEAQKILGKLSGDKVVPAGFHVSATCTRVPVLDGHTEAVFVATEKPCTPEAARKAFASYNPGLDGLPSAPQHFFTLHDDPFQPQPRYTREQDEGMSTHIGRIRPEKALSGIKYVLLSHNTKAGAAKGAILIAEMLVKAGDI